MFLFVVAIAATVTLISCSKSKEENGKLNSEQQVLLGKMNVSYNTAKVYNDSLINCNPTNSSYNMLTNLYDSCYHSNDSIFNHCHTNMMNIDEGMMNNNGGMMGGNGGMTSNNSMCNTQNDELNQVMINMNQLREIHKNYHQNN